MDSMLVHHTLPQNNIERKMSPILMKYGISGDESNWNNSFSACVNL